MKTAERFANGMKPLRRFVITERVFRSDCLVKEIESRVLVVFQFGDTRAQQVVSNRDYLTGRIQRRH